MTRDDPRWTHVDRDIDNASLNTNFDDSKLPENPTAEENAEVDS